MPELDLNKELEKRLPASWNAMGNELVFDDGSGKVQLSLRDNYSTFDIETITSFPERAGLGKKVVLALQEIATECDASIRAEDVWAPFFFEKFGFVIDDDDDGWQDNPDFWWFPPQ